MLSEIEAKRQIARLAGFARFDALGDAGVGELIRVLRESAASEDHAERSISAWIDANRWLPAPAELRDLVDQTPEQGSVSTVKPNRTCEHCQGSGWERTYLLVTFLRHPSGASKSTEEQEITAEAYARLSAQVDGKKQSVTTAAKACRCSYGQHLRRMRIARELEREQKREEREHRGSRRVA